MNRRLQNLIDKGMIPNKGGVFIDSYNQSVNEEISGTITTRIDASNMSYVTEPNVLTPKRTDFGKQVRKQYENKEINMSRHDMTQLEPRQDGVSNTITSVQKDNLLAEPIIIDDYNQRIPENQDVIGTVTTQFGNPAPRHGYKIAEPDWKTVVGNKQKNPFRGSVEGVSPCITSACGAGGGMTPMLTSAELDITKTDDFIEQVRGHQNVSYRIRKLTPRECFRLMGVTETDINKIQQSGVSQSQQYKMAGNSIVVDVLEHIFRKMFVDTGQESQQLSLF